MASNTPAAILADARQYESVDATTIDKGDVIINHQGRELTVEKVIRKEGKPFRVKFAGYDWQTVKPGKEVDRLVHGERNVAPQRAHKREN